MVKKTILMFVCLLSIGSYIFAQTDSLVIDEIGNVGIKTTEPATDLDVNGDIKAGNINMSGDLTAANANISGDITAANVEAKLASSQLDYIHAGSQVFLDSWSGALTPNVPVRLVIGYYDSILGYPLIPNPDPDNYDLVYRISVMGTNNNGYAPALFINGVQILNYSTWGNSEWRTHRASLFFKSWSDFPLRNCGSQNGLELEIMVTAGSTTTWLYGLTSHIFYVRKDVIAQLDLLVP